MPSGRICDECGTDLRYCEEHDAWHHDASFDLECSEFESYEFSKSNPYGAIVSVYTDGQAVEDGVLVDISNLNLSFRFRPLNRMTQHAYSDLEPFLEPYEIQFEGDPNWKMKGLARILRTKLAYAWYEGDIWHLPPRFWLIENEVDGWTVMFPEDY